MAAGWGSIIRLGLVQMALGSVVSLTTSTMNRVMVVELAMPAILPGLLVTLYYGTQFLRPKFGHSADLGGVAVRGSLAAFWPLVWAQSLRPFRLA